ncbi:MAG: ATP-binding cassette domain-containing protein [Thermoguttaceae bacterium]|nr:ATP-binding cassette domain-containing protein [Thermoguttaceae bacterium]
MSSEICPLSLHRIAFGYPGNRYYLFKDVHLELHRGELSILAGENGAGKSTLMGLTTGTLVPTEGTVRVFGKNPATLDRIPEIALISEPLHHQTSTIPPWFTGKQVACWQENLGSVSAKEFYETAEQLNLAMELMTRPICTYSKGQRQRFLLATVLARKPRLILADEPLEGIDAASRPIICQNFRKFTDQGGTLLWISHQLDETLCYADRFFMLEHREITERPSNQFTVQCEGDGKETKITSLMQLSGIVKRRLQDQSRVVIHISKN